MGTAPTTPQPETDPVIKLPTGIAGFDFIAEGGLPKGRTTLLAGSAGSGKTVFGAQFLAEGIVRDEPGVFVTFEESADDIRANTLGLGWDIPTWEEEGRWLFVDAAPRSFEVETQIGSYDLGALLARIEHAVSRTNAKRVTLDSLGALFNQFMDRNVVRAELLRIARTLRAMGVTSVMTAERTDEFGPISRHEVEEFVAENVIVLRNVLEEERRRRTMEILKFRGATHQKGQYPYTIRPHDGLIVIPLSAIELKSKSTNVRVTSGVTGLDTMCGGGFYRDSVILVSGATGTGKTLMTTEFVGSGAQNGERSLLFSFEESADQIERNAAGWGYDFDALEKSGDLKVVCWYPEAANLEDTLIQMKRIVDDYKPDRVAIDSLSALERAGSLRGFREFIIALTAYMKAKQVPTLVTVTTRTLAGGSSISEQHISTITDSIVLLRYVEIYGEIRRGLTVIKMRGSQHDKDIREFAIDGQGMHIGKPFRNVAGIMSGHPSYVAPGELEAVEALFAEPGEDGGL